MTLTPLRTAFLLAWTATLLVASNARAAIIPVLDLRQIHAKAVYEGAPDERTAFPFADFGAWDWYENAEVYGDEAGSASAFAYQNSQLYRDIAGTPTGFFHSGSTSGQFQVGVGSYDALSLSTMVFRLDTTSDYFIDATLDPGDPLSEGEILLGNPHGAGHNLEVNSGHVMLNGRLGPGDYFIEGRSQITTHGPSLTGPTYAIFMTIQPTNSPFIQLQPSNIAVPTGGNTNFTVTTSSPSPSTAQEGTAAFTLQWRRNGVPLANGAKYGGVTTSTLSISNAATADTGWYNVVVTSGPVSEPSGYARLAVGIVGVEPASPLASIDFRLDPASPNPSSTTTTFRFTTKQPVAAEAAVYDASGRRVRALSSGLLAGSGSFRWDGRAASGDTAPAGVYFLRVHVEGQMLVRRFVRMRS